ncbi:glycoside hydrolase superfamily [Leptodontidium sp. MPI-SDFR-AT-0119]|nr:glycoside hydrolase superfamily [Leptodontidium sp. MPI-SDFR-AT-0119]
MTIKPVLTAASFDVEEVIRNASIQEKINLLSGIDFWHTKPLPRFSVPSIRTSDGPNGIRGTKFFNSVPAACLPCGTALGATWDIELLKDAGILLGKECSAKGVSCWLGPTINIQRSPLGGRGFESFSEDPFLSGKLAGSIINGVQSNGTVATIKHFVANDQEHERMAVNAIISERALREIYLLPFQIAIADSSPGSVMTAYNKVNGEHVAESKYFIKDILRGEWGWEGLVMSDWLGTYSTSEALNAGMDLEMPGPTKWRGGIAELAVSSRKTTEATIDERVRNVLTFVKRASKAKVSPIEGKRDHPEDRTLNRKLASSGVVLLKNDTSILPFSKDIDEIALIGPGIKEVAFCGGGSARLEPYYTVSLYQGIADALGNNVKIGFEPGAYAHRYLPTLGQNIHTPDGMPGAVMSFYLEPMGINPREVVDQVVITDTAFQLMDYRHPRLSALYYTSLECIYTAPSTGQFEFGLTVFGSGNLYIDEKLIIENTENQRFGDSFFGKGTAEEKGVVDMEEGKSYRVRLEFGSSPTSKVVRPGTVAFPGGAGSIGAIRVMDEDESIKNAAALAARNQHVVLCAGLSKDWESEGFDRRHMDLPSNVSKLISSVLKANPNSVIVTQSGTPINMLPWTQQATTQVHSWFGGNELGHGIADVLFGQANPSGKLPLSFPKKLSDNPAFLNFGSQRGRVIYGEDVYVGYRYYEKLEMEVLFPFGHGLSYTTFAYTSLQSTVHSIILTVTNTGPLPGSDIVQLYVSPDSSCSIPRPVKELKGFTKVYLEAGESKQVDIQLDRFAFSFWDEILRAWVEEKGIYTLSVGRSSADILLEGSVKIEETRVWRGL